MKTIEKINKYYERKDGEPRYHLGCSEVGHKCDRWLWLSFRHAIKSSFSGRMLRLFELGHNWESRLVQNLRSIGVDIRNTVDGQINVDLGCHLSGSVDGIIYGGLPDRPDTKMIAEFKTANAKSFDYLENNGVRKAKYQHYVQMQLYMHALGIKHAFYMVECKNDSRLFCDIISHSKRIADKQMLRAHRIAISNDIPERISYDGSRFECRYCDAKGFCFKDEHCREINCRTCAHSTPKKDSTWHCELNKSVIPNEHQLKEYPCHVWHPGLSSLIFCGGDGVRGKFVLKGQEILNGKGAMSSREVLDRATT